MRWAGAVASLLAMTALLWGSAPPVRACSCAIPTGDAAAYYTSNAEIAVVGTVTGVVETEQPGRLVDVDLRVSAETYLKGSGPAEIVADDPIGGGDCGMFDASYVGRRYVFFFREDEHQFRIGLCSGNAPASEGFIRGVEEAAGTAPRAPERPGDDSAWNLGLAVAAVAIPLVFVLAASFVFPAKRSQT